MATAELTPTELAQKARTASLELIHADTAAKNAALEAMAALLLEREAEILAANARDLEVGIAAGLDDALIDRLTLSSERLADVAAAVRRIAELPDPVGEVIDNHRLPNGLELRKTRVPLGVIAVVYEARPNVTIDTAALCIKSGNAILLRGSSSAEHSNAVLAEVATAAVAKAGLPDGTVTLVAGGGRDVLKELATQDGYIDLIIPRGGEGLKAALTAVATVPVIYAAAGNCHVYVDRDASQGMASAIVVNAKMQRTGVCNAAETLLVHGDIAASFLPRVVGALREAGVTEFRVCGRCRELIEPSDDVVDATAEDWDTEYLAPTIAIKVVDLVAEAIEHINRHGSGHSEAIVTHDLEAAQLFERGVDAACVYVNASTRFTDGGEFGMGAEIGNATQKLHARGPIGLRELCTYKYIVEGDGQVRE